MGPVAVLDLRSGLAGGTRRRHFDFRLRHLPLAICDSSSTLRERPQERSVISFYSTCVGGVGTAWEEDMQGTRERRG
jgi:hypothetical protein